MIPSSEPATADVGRALEAAARAMCDRVNGAGDYDENLVQRRPGWVPQAKAGIDAYLAALSRAAPSSGHAMAEGEAPAGIYYSDEHGNFYDAVTHRGKGQGFWEQWRDRRYEFPVVPPTTPPTTNDAIPAGMVRWGGGRKPDDWSGEAVQFRSGEVMRAPPAGTVWKLGWDHCYGSGDIIAYTPKASAAPSAPATEAGEEA